MQDGPEDGISDAAFRALQQRHLQAAAKNREKRLAKCVGAEVAPPSSADALRPTADQCERFRASMLMAKDRLRFRERPPGVDAGGSVTTIHDSGERFAHAQEDTASAARARAAGALSESSPNRVVSCSALIQEGNWRGECDIGRFARSMCALEVARNVAQSRPPGVQSPLLVRKRSAWMGVFARQGAQNVEDDQRGAQTEGVRLCFSTGHVAQVYWRVSPLSASESDPLLEFLSVEVRLPLTLH